MHVYSYDTARDYLGKKTDRPLSGRASRLIRRSESAIAVRYQSTDVVTYHDDGTITLQSDGWQTVTTKARITEYTKVRLFADKGIWYVGGDWSTPRENRMLYVDGMTITVDGQPTHPTYPTQADAQAKRALDKAISAYIKGFAARIVEHGLDDPSGGDCWGCYMQAQTESVTQGSYGRENRPTPHGRVEVLSLDHYLSHFEESYYVPSLLLNAIKARGYRDPGFIWHLIKTAKDSQMAAGILRAYFKNLKPALLAEKKRMTFGKGGRS